MARRQRGQKRWLGGVIALVIATVGIPLSTQAQISSEITPSGLQPPLQRMQGSMRFTGAPGLGAPEGADRLSVALAGISVEGGRPEMAEAERTTQARLTSGRIAVSEIFAAAQDLEASYARSGYVLARVVLPEQTLLDGGRLRLVVIDGFIEDIESANLPDRVRPRVESLVQPLAGRQGMTLSEIERALLLAGDTFGVALESALATGRVAGSTRLVLGGQFRPMTGHVGINNGYDRDLGRYGIEAGLEVNGQLGLYETIYFRLSGHPRGGDSGGIAGFFGDRPRMRTVAAGFILPVGNRGLTFNLEATESRTTPRVQPGAPATASAFERLSFRLGAPIIRSRQTNLSALLSFDMQSDRLNLLAPGGGQIGIHYDKLRILRAAVTYSRALERGGIFSLGATLSAGLSGLGARTAAEATPALPLSRQGADARFTKLELNGNLQRPLGETVQLSLSGRAQTSFGRPLVKSEQVGFASARELSTFTSGTISGDGGWFARAEISTPRQIALQGQPAVVSPFVFLGAGTIYLEAPTALEQRRTNLVSYGFGIELTALSGSPFSGATVRAEYGRGLRNDTRPDANRFSLMGSYRF